jgi:hypothetical protein
MVSHKGISQTNTCHRNKGKFPQGQFGFVAIGGKPRISRTIVSGGT